MENIEYLAKLAPTVFETRDILTAEVRLFAAVLHIAMTGALCLRLAGIAGDTTKAGLFVAVAGAVPIPLISSSSSSSSNSLYNIMVVLKRAFVGNSGPISSSGPKFVFAAEFRLQGRISSSGPNFGFAAEFRLQGRISRLQRSIPEPRTLSNSLFGPNFVFRTNSSSQEIRLHGRFSSSHFVFAYNLSFSSLRTISSSKASEFRLQGGGGYETGTHFAGSLLMS